MTNLQKTTENPTLHWRISLDNLEEGLDEIGQFPYEVSEQTFAFPTLFIKGEKSKYINRKNTDLISSYFPKSKIEIVQGAGHWGESSVFKSQFQAFMLLQYTRRNRRNSNSW